MYAVEDFAETLARVSLDPRYIRRVAAAYGRRGDYCEWEGGFFLEMLDGTCCLITGWCDTTGWGCQDGADLEWRTDHFLPSDFPPDADLDPADLRVWLAQHYPLEPRVHSA